MATTSTRTCDLCKLEIKPEKPFALLDLPLNETDREKFRDNAKAHMPAGLLNLMPIDRMIPSRWRLEVCTGCMAGFMAAAFDAVSEGVAALLLKQRGPEIEIIELDGGGDGR